jgi:gliding motility-associated-like protein
MKNLLLLICLSVCFSSFAQERDINERYLPKKESEQLQKEAQAKPYISKKMLRGGGGEITSTDCYSFVPIPDSAIELDENTPDSGNSLDGAWGPFDLDFEFCHFGINYDQFYINMKGNITFDNFNTSFVPAGFPSDDFAMIAGYWADIDLQCAGCGTVYYWTTPTAAYITYLDVGYYNQHGNLNNTFQIVITDQSDEAVGLGNNVGLFYQDMQWAAGDWNGGTNGFGGTAAGTVGANRNDGVNFIQFGRFLDDSSDYDGPFGAVDGIDWLDDKSFVFNICSTEDNLPPIAGNSDACDTLFICQNDTYEFDLSFIGPEPGQTVTITVDDSEGDGWVMTSNGDGFMTGYFEGGSGNVGEHILVFTATDNGSPAAQSVVIYNIVVQDITLPELTVTGLGYIDDVIPYCGGQPGANLTASDGFDDYVWSNNTNGQTNTLAGGIYSLIGILEGCQTEYGPISVYQIPSFNPLVVASDYFLCDGEETELVLQDENIYSEYIWEVFNANGEILSSDLDNDSITVTPGTFQVTAINADGCQGSVVIPIQEEIVNVPNVNFLAQCDEDDLIEWTGAWADPNTCVYPIYLYDSEGDSWEGANVEVYVDGTGPLNYNISGSSGFSPDGFNVFHGQLIEYFFTSGLDDDDVRVQIYNTNSVVVFDTDEGDLLIDNGLPFFTQQANCGFNALPGTWEVDVPAGGEGYTLEYTDVFNPVNDDNVFTAPLGFVGTYDLTFTSDVCDRVEEVSLTFSVTPTVQALDYESCDNESVSIEPIYGPSDVINGATYTWIPNNLGNGPTAEASSSINYIIEIENVCGNSQDQGEIIIVPTPTAILFNDVLCDGATSILSPSGLGDPSWVFDWSTGEDTPSIQVSSANDYSVTVSNDCGTAQASAFINTSNSPAVTYLTDTLFYCAGDVQTIAPTWAGGTPFAAPITWELEYLDVDGAPFTETLSSSETSIQVGSDQIPPPADAATLTFTANDYCGTAQEEVVLQLIPCFIQAPNVITPDSDGETAGYFSGGLNEAWYIEGIERLQNVQVRIFNRWGNLVYENDNYSNNNPWDGKTTKGDELEDGVYFYTITASENIDPVEGTVTIFRK